MKMRRLSCVVDLADEGRQVQALLRERFHMGRQGIRSAKFRENGITLNGKHALTIDRVRAGQVLSIAVGDTKEALENSRTIATPGTLDIVFEDEDLIVLNKPAGISTHPGPKHPADTLGNVLVYYFERTHQQCLLHPVQRLDWGTSGLIVFAKNAHAQDFLQKRLHTDGFRREYVAFCQGSFNVSEGTVTAPIGCVNHVWQVVDDSCGGKPACTHYRVEAQSNAGAFSVSRVWLQLETGRTHQIRIHLSHLGHPLLGDAAYGGCTQRIERPALHSSFLQIEHPVSGECMAFTAPLPSDMAVLDV